MPGRGRVSSRRVDVSRLGSSRSWAISTGLAVAGIGFWATNAWVGGEALEEATVLQVLFVQLSSAAVVLRVVTTARQGSARDLRVGTPAARSRVVDHLVGVVGLGGTMVLQYVAFANAPLVTANILAYSWPMIAVVVLVILTRASGLVSRLALSGVGFLGVVLVVLGQAGDPGSGQHPVLGYVAALGSAACMAFYTVAMRRVTIPLTSLMLTTTATGAVLAGCALVAVGDGLVSGRPLLLATYVGVGPVVAGYLLWSLAMRHSGGRLSPLGFLTPVLSTLVLLLDGQALGGVTAVGAVVVLTSTALLVGLGRGSVADASEACAPESSSAHP